MVVILPKALLFCENCGASVRQAPSYQPVPPPAPKPQPQSSNKGLLTALVVLLALLLVGGIAYFAIDQKNKKNQELQVQLAQQSAETARLQAEAEQRARADEEARREAERAETMRETGPFDFTGTVAGKNVTMHLDVDSYGNASGWYYYNKYRKKLGLSGTYSNGYISLTEYDVYGDYNGYFSGTYSGRHIKGDMTNDLGNTYSFRLSR